MDLEPEMLGQRFTFTATKGGEAWKLGFGTDDIPILALKDVRLDGEPFAEKVYFDWSEKTKALDLHEGDYVRFNARIDPKNSIDVLANPSKWEVTRRISAA